MVRRGTGIDSGIARSSGGKGHSVISRTAQDYPYADTYWIIPGPNSNTFTAALMREVPDLTVELPPHAVGKDYLPGGIAGRTESGTGIRINLWGLAGFSLGLAEGAEVSLLGLNAGFDLLRPALKLPMIGRIGAARRSCGLGLVERHAASFRRRVHLLPHAPPHAQEAEAGAPHPLLPPSADKNERAHLSRMVRKPFSLIPFPVHGKKGNKAEIRLPSADEAVRIRAMKKLLIRSCLIAGLAWTASCSSNKETAPQEPAPAPAVQPEQTAAADRPAPWAPAPVKPAILPQEENAESVPGPAVLPGDFRPGLRTPRLPETLLYDLDGKLITPSAP